MEIMKNPCKDEVSSENSKRKLRKDEKQNRLSEDLCADQVQNRWRERKVRKRKEKRGRRKGAKEVCAQRIRRDLVKAEHASGVLSR